MKYTLKIVLVALITAALLSGVIWTFSSIQKQGALTQYIATNQDSANTIQYAVQDNITDFTDSENNIDYVGLVNSLPMYGFDSVTILNKNGTVLASTSEKIKAAYINSLSEECKNVFFNENGGNIIWNGFAYYFAKIINDDYRVMCLLPESELVAQKTHFSALSIVEILIIFIILAGCITLIILFYKQKFDVLYKVKPVNNYTMATTSNGKFLYADDNFNKTFGHVNIDECFIKDNDTFSQSLTSGKLLLFALKNKQDETRKIAFNATSGIGEYKLVGSDITSFMDEYDQLVHEFETDDQTGLANIYPFKKDWEEFLSTQSYKDGLICFLGLPNIDYYRTLYGEELFSKGIRYISQIISEQLCEYGKLYTIKSQTFLLIKDKALKNKFVTNIKQIQEKLSETIEVYDHYIKLDIRLGVIFLTTLTKDTDFDCVFNEGIRVLKYAQEIEDAPYYIQRATTFKRENYQIITHEMLNELITKGSIDVHFQPQIDVKTEKVVGFEALFRFTDPQMKNISVYEFIASAEKQGCIVELGEFIYKKAMDFACLVQKYDLTVSINISPIQLMQIGFVEKFLQAYKERKIKPGIVHIEIVESTMIYSIKDVIQKIQQLKVNGIHTEIDDFGIAYSSLLYLKKLPITTIKIDKAFIDNIENNEKDKLLIKNIISITKDFGLTCIAEGVEQKGQKEILKKLGCDIIQGYYYSKAIPKEKVFDYIQKMNKIGGGKL